ncbi:hypothetical protein D3C80_1807310 [compost metagenome]
MGLAIEQGQRQITTGQQLFKLRPALRAGARHDEPHTGAHGSQALGSIEKQCAESTDFAATTARH